MIWNENGFQNLANAIILQAVKDYRKVRRMLAKNPGYSMALKEKKKIEGFFVSEYFATLTKINGTKLLTKLQEEQL